MHIGTRDLIQRKPIAMNCENFVIKAAENCGLASLDMKRSWESCVYYAEITGCQRYYRGNHVPYGLCLDECY